MEPHVLMTWSPLLGSVNGDHQLRRDLAAQDDELVVLLRQDERPIVEAPPPAAPGAVGHVPVPEGLEDGYAGADDAHGGVFERDAHDLESAVAEEEARRRVARVAGEVVPPRQGAPGGDAERVRHDHVPADGRAVPVQPNRRALLANRRRELLRRRCQRRRGEHQQQLPCHGESVIVALRRSRMVQTVWPTVTDMLLLATFQQLITL